METIKGHCFTNLDDYDVSHVKEFARVPNVGERVRVSYKGANTSTLKVCQITHDYRNDKPYIVVELHR